MKAGWKTEKIGDICELATGGTPSRSSPEYFNGEIKWLVSGDIHQKEIFDCKGRISDAGMKNSNARLLPINSVMIALNGQGKTRGSVALLRTNTTCNQSLVSISPKYSNQLLPEFLYLNLNGRYEEIRRITGDDGNDRRGLNMPLIRNIEIPIAPISEQQRIVAILDEAFEQIAIARANTEKNLQNARALFESHLQSALTTNANDWKIGVLGHVCEELFAGGDVPKENSSKVKTEKFNIPIFTNGEKKMGLYGFTNTPRVTQPSITVSARGTIGYSEIRNEPFYPAIRLIVLTPKTDVMDLFFLKSLVKNIDFIHSGTSIPQLTVPMIKEYPIKYPALELQKTLVQDLDKLNEETQRLESLYQRKLTALDELKKSLLHKAFAGEL